MQKDCEMVDNGCLLLRNAKAASIPIISTSIMIMRNECPPSICDRVDDGSVDVSWIVVCSVVSVGAVDNSCIMSVHVASCVLSSVFPMIVIVNDPGDVVSVVSMINLDENAGILAAGSNLLEIPVGSPVTDNSTSLSKLFIGVMVTIYSVISPWTIS